MGVMMKQNALLVGLHPDQDKPEADYKTRLQRARAITAGQRAADGLTAAERALIDDLKNAGYEVSRKPFNRTIRKTR